MINRLRSMYREISEAPAGERFYRYHRRRRHHAARTQTVLYVMAGVLLLVSGFLLSLPPLMPGFLLWLPGLALIASQFGRVAQILDRLEVWMLRLYRRLPGRGKDQ